MTTNFDEFEIAFRNFIIDDLDVNELIANRFYPSELATLTNPTFPLGTFYSESGDSILAIIQKFTLNVNTYSNVSYEQALLIYNAIFERCKNVYIEGKSIAVRPRSTPYKYFDEIARIYGVTGKFQIVWISG
jgi:hypothetical protein